MVKPIETPDNSGNMSCIVRVRDEEGLADLGTYTLSILLTGINGMTTRYLFSKIEVSGF